MQLALPDCYFDAVLCMGVMDALQDRRQAVREMLRVLRSNGTLIVTFTNFRSPYAWWRNFVFYPLVSLWHAARTHIGQHRPKATRRLGGKTRALYSELSARRLLESEGATINNVVRYYFNVLLSPLDEAFPSVALSVTRRFEEGTWPRWNWMASGLILKATKRETANLR
jgi:ubiquinone/menaquinone biosynthesis C-methylase UbiE